MEKRACRASDFIACADTLPIKIEKRARVVFQLPFGHCAYRAIQKLRRWRPLPILKYTEGISKVGILAKPVPGI